MNEAQLRRLVDDVHEGRLARRGFIQRMVSLGLTAPMAAQLLLNPGEAHAQAPASVYKPTKRGGGGALKCLFWQGATLLNPHFATGNKDAEGARVFYEPLAAYDAEGLLVPVLAAQIPSRANGGLAADGKTVTWKLKPGVTWHDGKPFTADDCVFNWEYSRDPATATTTGGSFTGFKAERVDDLTLRITFDKPSPFWSRALCTESLIPKHLFSAYTGAKSRDAPANLKPVGTGPYKFVDFKPGDLLRGALNPNYHMPNRPYFDTIEIKGGGDATSAARAVLQTGEYDYAWNLQVEDEVLKRMEDGGKGRVVITVAGDIEFMQLNMTDPWTEVDGERASIKSRHFAFSDLAVRQAMALLADRKGIQDFIYGRTGIATPNYLNAPSRFRSPNNRFEFNVDKANALLEDAGWKKGADGVRAKGGRKLKLVFQTSVNGIRQKEQAVIKQACQKAGIDLELKSVSGSVFFSTDLANPDTNGKFWCDMQMFTSLAGAPDPALFMNRFTRAEISQKANKWQGRNLARWHSDAYEKLYAQAESELDPVKRAAMYIALNDLVIRDVAVVPLINRTRVTAASTKLKPVMSGWDLDFSQLHDWYREA
ncbi:peptide ABC transporter substrate-binding protein [Caenimonas aquaedulcis]|uniref:Peptide ABC transporter substrate-binding protein n=1 Tax=Caenimonas aquaedulcis TaxID=2793270 RepID=A0A931H4H1_9BURK|nr:peptide ABC transporter substrate-binding protein [Caenimonas aquaedulcis]MBG9388446.1 peptide ABC transporter substrate-binding protein [Caenimonas aquaedulcis]